MPGSDRQYSSGQTSPVVRLQSYSMNPGPTRASNKKLAPSSTKVRVYIFYAINREVSNLLLWLISLSLVGSLLTSSPCLRTAKRWGLRGKNQPHDSKLHLGIRNIV